MSTASISMIFKSLILQVLPRSAQNCETFSMIDLLKNRDVVEMIRLGAV